MARPRLKLVISNPPASPRWQGTDSIFFHKSQLRIGSKLENFGRTAHGTTWTITEIRTYRITPSGRAIASKAAIVTKLKDDIILLRDGSNDTRQLSFATLSYSSIWRII